MSENIRIDSMHHPKAVSYFLRKLIKCIDDDEIHINFVSRDFYPCACVPISAMLDELRCSGKNVFYHFDKKSYLGNTNFNLPYKVCDHKDSLKYPFSKLWKFDTTDEVALLVDAFKEEIQAQTECSKGTIDGLDWALNEVMDNVIQHSISKIGYIMGIYHKTNNYLLFTIYDGGQGIYNSLMNSEYSPRNAIDAISLSVRLEIRVLARVMDYGDCTI